MKGRFIVKHSDKLTKGRSKLTAVQMKVFLQTITLVNMSDVEFKETRLPIKNFCSEVGLFLDKKFVIDLCDKLSSQVYSVFNEFKKSKFRYDNFPIYKRFSVDLEREEIIFCFNDYMREFLLELRSKFTKYDIRYILNLKSKYSIRIYQILKNLRDLTRQKEFDLTEFQDMLNVPQTKRAWANFKNDILKKSIDEINEFTDLQILNFYEEKKIRKKVISFSLKFCTKDEFKEIEYFTHMGLNDREIWFLKIKNLIGSKFLINGKIEILEFVNLPESDGKVQIFFTQNGNLNQYFFNSFDDLKKSIENARNILDDSPILDFD
ncbi:replication initiation protein [Campylobacter coli]|nr:replication initiation protein [Campylobacter jejuni]EGC6701139.1 replication initiation protein [Campylobacter coli]EHO4923628.1 replication initiation protein [Campylobacter coli]